MFLNVAYDELSLENLLSVFPTNFRPALCFYLATFLKCFTSLYKILILSRILFYLTIFLKCFTRLTNCSRWCSCRRRTGTNEFGISNQIYGRAAFQYRLYLLPVERECTPSMFLMILPGYTSHRRASDQRTRKTLWESLNDRLFATELRLTLRLPSLSVCLSICLRITVHQALKLSIFLSNDDSTIISNSNL